MPGFLYVYVYVFFFNFNRHQISFRSQILNTLGLLSQERKQTEEGDPIICKFNIFISVLSVYNCEAVSVCGILLIVWSGFSYSKTRKLYEKCCLALRLKVSFMCIVACKNYNKSSCNQYLKQYWVQASGFSLFLLFK